MRIPRECIVFFSTASHTNLHTVEIIILMPLTAVTAVEDVTSQSQVQGPDNCSTVSTASGHGGTIGPGH